MLQIPSAFAAGLLFGVGIVVSEMANPEKVLAFLDVFGAWDPSLAFVMIGAVAVSGFGYALARRMGLPVLAPRLEIPTRRDIEPRLLAGAAIFGVGWGLAGLCPGPALTALSFGPRSVVLFVAAMLAGMALYRLLPTEGARAPMLREPTASRL